MKTIDITTATGADLDWLVEVCISLQLTGREVPLLLARGEQPSKPYSSDWSLGMLILDGAGVVVRKITKPAYTLLNGTPRPAHPLHGKYLASTAESNGASLAPRWQEWDYLKSHNGTPARAMWIGSTHLEAGLRCYVANVLGLHHSDEVTYVEVGTPPDDSHAKILQAFKEIFPAPQESEHEDQNT